MSAITGVLWFFCFYKEEQRSHLQVGKLQSHCARDFRIIFSCFSLEGTKKHIAQSSLCFLTHFWGCLLGLDE